MENGNQTVQSLAQQAGLRIPIKSLFFATEPEGNVINQEFFQYLRIHPKYGSTDMKNLCDCNIDGDCLCYLFKIRHMMMDCYWATPTDYVFLADWLTLSNAHN